ncbi:MAG: thiosulfate oxidation carrier complex protein SoxZ [Pseudomonadota bacterium]|nr:thiosulfate oxidation carrier complex protein SoxZ [Pseudomonadota bacterium]
MADTQHPMRLRVKRAEGRVTVKLLIAHPMDTGLAKDADGHIVPAWFIRQVEAWVDDTRVLAADWGTAVARNPFLEFELESAVAGATLRLRWRDSQGLSGEDSVELP